MTLAEAVELSRTSKFRFWRRSWKTACVELCADGSFVQYLGTTRAPWTPTAEDLVATDWVAT